MGLFDIFTGDPAKEAAQQNTTLLNNNLASGTNILNTGQTNALGALNNAAGAYQPLTNLANEYGGGTTMLLNSLGLNGQSGNDAATAAFQNNPGYQGAITAGLDAINRRRAAGGMLNSGNADQDAQTFGQNLQNQQYQNWQTQLGGLNNNALSATGAAAQGVAGADTNQANVYGNTAQSLTNLGTTTATGIANQNTQSANAQMAGSGNLWNLGLNVAKLGAGALGGSSGGSGFVSGL